MALRLDARTDDFSERFRCFVAMNRAGGDAVEADVAAIVADVRGRGFQALADKTRQFDHATIDETNVRVSAQEIEAAQAALDPGLVAALQHAAARIRAYHDRQRPDDQLWRDAQGVTLGWRWNAVDAAGLYAPGGRAAYPSSVLMNAIPAKVAGVRRIALATPAPAGVMNPAVIVAAAIAGVDEIWRVGGAQAIAALAFGAGPIAPVDVIVGPGNAYVAEAKRQVFGRVGIDSIAGPSEILVVADAQNDPTRIAADLLSQAEHDPSSQAVLIADDAGFADQVAAAVEAQIAASARRQIAQTAWTDNSAIIVVADLAADAPPLIDAIAPEHLELAVAEPELLLARVRHAGAVFLGRMAPEAIGDYLAGPNHVLPTAGAARYASGLSVLNFMKRTSIIGADAAALAAIGPDAARLADAEGLPSHAASIRLRLDQNP
jgi:histidinol dehydrogenase